MTPLIAFRRPPRRIALVKPSALGDVVHSLPVLSALRRHWPEAHITWVINRSYAPLVEGHPELDAVVAFDRGAVRRGPLPGAVAATRFIRELRAGRFDLVVDLQGLLRTGIMGLLSGARVRAGFAAAREGAAQCYTHRVEVPDADRIHAVDRYWRVALALGCPDGPKRFHVPIAPEADAQARRWLAGFPRPWLAIAVGARWETKRWPAKRFGHAARLVLARSGGTAVFVGGPEDAPLAELARAELTGPNLNLCGLTSLPQLAAVLAQADAFFGNDTGPLHLAAALGRPAVAPYTCTLVARHGPYGDNHLTASASIECHGSYLKKCAHMSCLATLPVERLAGLLTEVLHSWPLNRPA